MFIWKIFVKFITVNKKNIIKIKKKGLKTYV